MRKIKSHKAPASTSVVLVKGHQSKDDHTYVFWTLKEAIEKAKDFAEKHNITDQDPAYANPQTIQDVGATFAYDASRYIVLTLRDIINYLEMEDGRLSDLEDISLFLEKLHAFRSNLDSRDLCLLDYRLLTYDPMSLQNIGKQFHVSRERVRQIEERLIAKLRRFIAEEIPQLDDDVSLYLHKLPPFYIRGAIEYLEKVLHVEYEESNERYYISPDRRLQLRSEWRNIYWPDFTGNETIEEINLYFSIGNQLSMFSVYDLTECDFVRDLAMMEAGH